MYLLCRSPHPPTTFPSKRFDKKLKFYWCVYRAWLMIFISGNCLGVEWKDFPFHFHFAVARSQSDLIKLIAAAASLETSTHRVESSCWRCAVKTLGRQIKFGFARSECLVRISKTFPSASLPDTKDFLVEVFPLRLRFHTLRAMMWSSK